MLKPTLLKSLIAQNASLARQNQTMMQFFRVLETSLGDIQREGKDTGVVRLEKLHNMRTEIKKVVNNNNHRTLAYWHTLEPPTKKDLDGMANPNNTIADFFKSEHTPKTLEDIFGQIFKDMISPPDEKKNNKGTDISWGNGYFEDPQANPFKNMNWYFPPKNSKPNDDDEEDLDGETEDCR